MSYIVKNCPAITNNLTCRQAIYENMFCDYRTDCVIKQVIEKCKDSILSCCKWEILRTACETSEAYGRANIAEQILQLFDIEEINK